MVEPLEGVTVSQLSPEGVEKLVIQVSVPRPVLRTPKLCEGGAAPTPETDRNVKPRCDSRSNCSMPLTVITTGMSTLWPVVELEIVTTPR